VPTVIPAPIFGLKLAHRAQRDRAALAAIYELASDPGGGAVARSALAYLREREGVAFRLVAGEWWAEACPRAVPRRRKCPVVRLRA
jgi:hypothetical protein